MSTTFYQIAELVSYPFLGVAASFFWGRGVWRGSASDRVLACCLIAVMCIFGVVFGMSCEGFNIAGGWLCFLGVATLIAGLFLRGRGWSFHRAFRAGGLMIILGVLLALML